MSKQSMVKVKQEIARHFPVEISLLHDELERVFHSEILEIEEGAIALAPISWFGETLTVKPGDNVRVSFLLGDTFYSYTSHVISCDETGKFFVADVEYIPIVGERKGIRIATEIRAKCKILRDASGFLVEKAQYLPAHINNLSTGGVGFLCSQPLERGVILLFQFNLPESKHGVIQVHGRVLRSHPIAIKNKEEFYNEVAFVDMAVENEERVYEWIFGEIEKITKTEFELKSIDPAVQVALAQSKVNKIETIWDRFEVMQPQCSFGELGICCRNCMQGPCRIDPFGEGARKGICGATADTMVARNLIRMIAAGAAAHSEHALHQVHVLHAVAKGRAKGYAVKDRGKLQRVARMIGKASPIPTLKGLAKAVAEAAFSDFSHHEVTNVPLWTKATIPKKRIEIFSRLGVLPYNLDNPIIDIMHRTHIGVDHDPVNLILAGIRCAIADFTVEHIATDVSDILFGTPRPVVTETNLGVLEKDAVNIAVHGHNPILSEVICDVAPGMRAEAAAVGAKDGINIVGICCTGNEVLMRHGIPLAGNFLSQEMAILTGALDAMVVDYQCIMPSVASVARCFHTRIITTMSAAKLAKEENVVHIPLDMEDLLSSARKVIRHAILAFERRNPTKIAIPQYREKAIVGFSVEAILEALKHVNKEDPLKPLSDNIISGNVRGIALLCGCNNVQIRQDFNVVTMVKGLLKNNILVVTTGCNAGALAKAGFMSQEATKNYAGDRLREVLTAIGEAAKIGGPLPPVLHLGSCVDNSRAIDIVVALANKFGVDIASMPVVASAPEPMSEKAIAIGTWAVAMGIPTHLGLIPPIWGGSQIITILTETAKELLGGYFIVELNPFVAVNKLVKVINERRQELELSVD